jgi:hypothetical protein
MSSASVGILTRLGLNRFCPNLSIHYSQIILSVDVLQPEILTVLQTKPQGIPTFSVDSFRVRKKFHSTLKKRMFAF